MFLIRNNLGQSLVEVIIALAIFSLVASSLVAMIIGSLDVVGKGGNHAKAEALAQEGMEAVRSIKDRAWNKGRHNQSAVEVSASSWDFSGEGTTEQIGDFTRVIEFDDVCRNSSGDIAPCPSAFNDVHTKKVTVTVSWQTSMGLTNEVEKITYITNWDTKEWIEDFVSDFGDGIFNNTTTTSEFGDGSITLDEN